MPDQNLIDRRSDLLAKAQAHHKANGSIERRSFLRESGVTEHEFAKLWESFGAFLTEAGLPVSGPSRAAGGKDALLEALLPLIRAAGVVPTWDETDRSYERGEVAWGKSTYRKHLGNRAGLMTALADYISRNPDKADGMPDEVLGRKLGPAFVVRLDPEVNEADIEGIISNVRGVQGVESVTSVN